MRALLAALLLAAAPPQGSVRPLVRAHSHNDYEHARPLLDALDQGFCSVEADIWLVDGKLLVAHDLPKAKPERTLQSLYLDPLAARVKRNGGRVFRDGPGFSLLVDIKSDAEATYAALAEALRPHRSMLTRFAAGSTTEGAVTVIVSGNRPREQMLSERDRFCGYDGRPADLAGTQTRHFMPWISESWQAHFRWRGTGEFRQEERAKLAKLVEEAHLKGMRVRFWAAPDVPALWRELQDAGVDLINTDRLIELRQFLTANALPL